MDASFIKMDIFFLVATTAVILVSIFVIVILYYVARIVRDISNITKTIDREVHDIAGDIGAMRAGVREGVTEVRERFEQGLATAKAYGSAVAGAGMVRALSTIFSAFAEGKEKGTKRPRRAKPRAHSGS